MSYLEENIKEVLQQKKKTLSWLATQLGYSRQGLSNGLTNKTIKFDTLERITKVLEVPLSSILGKNIITYDDPEKEKIIQSLSTENERLKNKLDISKYKTESNEALIEAYKISLEINERGFDSLFDFVMKLEGFKEDEIITDPNKLKTVTEPLKTPLLYLSSLRYYFLKNK